MSTQPFCHWHRECVEPVIRGMLIGQMATSRTCTILFTDLVGSTELRSRLGDDAFDDRRRGHDRLIVDALARHDGELVKHEGDGVMAVFASAADALSCAITVQQGART